MRAPWILSLLVLSVSAHPAGQVQVGAKIPPNDVDILGGDFGLANTPMKTELYNWLAPLLLPSNSGQGPPPKSSLTNYIHQLIEKSNATSMFEGFGGDNLIEWAYSQFAFWMVGQTAMTRLHLSVGLSNQRVNCRASLTGCLVVVHRDPERRVTETTMEEADRTKQTIRSIQPYLREPSTRPQRPKNESMPVVVWVDALHRE